jgi:hypothetical protein
MLGFKACAIAHTAFTSTMSKPGGEMVVLERARLLLYNLRFKNFRLQRHHDENACDVHLSLAYRSTIDGGAAVRRDGS